VFEGMFLSEWWLVHTGDINELDVGYKSDECRDSTCINIKDCNIGAVFLIGYSSHFPTSKVEKVSFYARLSNEATAESYNDLIVTFDDCKATKNAGKVTKEWTHYTIDIKALKCPKHIKILKFILPNAKNILLDDIEMIPV